MDTLPIPAPETRMGEQKVFGTVLPDGRVLLDTGEILEVAFTFVRRHDGMLVKLKPGDRIAARRI